jgi:hypothetical protein
MASGPYQRSMEETTDALEVTEMFDADLYYELARQRGKELIAEAELSRAGNRVRRNRHGRHGGRWALRHTPAPAATPRS